MDSLARPATGGGGSIKKAASSTDKALTRWKGTEGKEIQGSQVIVDDDGNITTPGNVTAGGNVDVSGSLSKGGINVSLEGHEHVIGNVSGLQTALDGKSSTGHGHGISEVTGLQTALDSKATSAALSSHTGDITKHRVINDSGIGNTDLWSAQKIIAHTTSMGSGQGVNVKSFGAIGDGVADDRTAIVNAIASLTSGGIVYFPAGTYKTSAGIVCTTDNIAFVGEGIGASIISGSFASGDILRIGSPTTNTKRVRLTGLQITSSVAMTGGSGLHVSGARNIMIDNILIKDNMYVGIQFEGGGTGDGQCFYRLENFAIESGLHGILFGDGAYVVDVWVGNGFITGTTDAGIMMKNAGAISLRDLHIKNCNAGVITHPNSDQHVVLLWMENVSCNSCTRDGFMLLTNGGSLTEVTMTGCTALTNANHGMQITASTGIISGVTITGQRCINNAYHGIVIADGNTSKIGIVNAQCMANSTAASGFYHGISFHPGLSDFTITGGNFGSGGLFSPNPQGYGIFINLGASNNYSIVGANCLGNTIGAISDYGTGTNKYIIGVLG